MLTLILNLLTSFWSLNAAAFDFEGGGSFKNLTSFEKLRQKGIFQRNDNFLNESRFRLQGALQSTSLRFEFANETFLYHQRPNPALIPLPSTQPQSAWSARWDLVNQPYLEIVNRMDRLFVQWDFHDFQFRLGKQVISLGVGQIFNAVSQMQRYPLIFIDPEFPKTEDAASFHWSGPVTFEARLLPKVPGQLKDNFHLRAKSNQNGWDFALAAGRSDDKTFFGLESAGNLGDSLLRLEAVGYTLSSKDYAQGLIGWDRVFSAVFSTKLEIFYNGFGEDSHGPLTPFRHRSAPFRGTWYVGNASSLELHPLLKIYGISVLNMRDPSLLLHLFLNYSLSNTSDLLLGGYFGFGNNLSEFGGEPSSDISYLAIRWYF